MSRHPDRAGAQQQLRRRQGAGQKADDIFVAITCRHCHDALDGRKRIESAMVDFDRTLLAHYHDRAIKRSIRIFIDKGVIK